MHKRIFTLFGFLAFASILLGQQFVSPAVSFSHKKTVYVTLNNGEQLTGIIKDLDRKKGLIEEIKMKLDNGKKRKIDPKDIKFAYLPPSGFDKVIRSADFITDAAKWDAHDLDKDIIGQGYAYFEKSVVRIKKKERTLLLQLMNPSFSSRVKVYQDPAAKETVSIGVGALQVAGGLEKSYYIKLGDETAYRVKKKDYDEEFKLIFSGCDAVLNDTENANKWNKFEHHVWVYGKKCK
ncbi:MAG: hypothetical protein GY705_28560 [Bacteroidetes bacterium]|nr:hypothetical protein [Bacteroidota bacterium]